MLADQLRDTRDRIAAVTARIEAPQREDPLARRLASVPGIGVITARAGGHDTECRGLPIGAGLRRVARSHAQGAFPGWEGAAWRDLEGG